MVHLRRLIFALLALSSSVVFAAISLSPTYTVAEVSGSFSTPDSACAAYYAYRLTHANYDFTGYFVAENPWRCALRGTLGGDPYTPSVYIYSKDSCPANSTASGASCFCNSGFIEKGGQCTPKKSDVCGSFEGMPLGLSSMESDFGPQSSSWAANKLGKSGNACMTGCQVSGSVSSCVVGSGGGSTTVCFLSKPSFTGSACSDPSSGGSGGDGTDGGKDKPNDCPVGYEPSKYAPGVCIPKPNNCPSGSSPSKYVEGICIPDEKGDDGSCEDPKDPTKRAECEGKENKCPSGQVQSKTQVGTCVPGTDGSGKDSAGNKVECKNGVCTTTKPDGSKEDKDQKGFCKENPDLSICKENKDTFGGSCDGGFSCEGDALQCAMAKEQHIRNCQLYAPDKDVNSLTNKALNGTDDKSADALKASAGQINVTTSFDQSGLGWSHSCPADPHIPLNFGGRSAEFTIPFSRICGPLGILSLAGVGITLLGCGVWVLGGKKEG